MKRMSTTSSRRQVITRATIGSLVVVVSIATPLGYVQQALADQWDNQISALQQQANQYQAQASQYQAKAATLQQALDQITAQKNALIAQINISQQQYDLLQQQIDSNQKKIEAAKDALGDTIADLYVSDDVSSVEMLASSKNVGDFLDKQTYQTSIQDTLTKTIDQIKTLKKQLQTSQDKLKVVLQQQESQKASLAASEAQQAQLVAETKGQEAAYQQLVSNTQSQMASAAAQQRAYYASLQAQGGGGDSGVVGSFQYANWSGNMGCGGGGYPYCAGGLDYNYPSGSAYALYYRECVDYVAWRMDHVYGKRVGSFGGVGMAYQWINWDNNTGTAYKLGAVQTSNPQPGDAVILPRMAGFAPMGHAMIVESAPSNGWVHVSQYNFYGTGEYSTMDIKTSGVIFLRFPNG